MLKKQFFQIIRPELANKSFKWMIADTEENYKKISRKIKVPYGPNDIEYKYNNYGFRCDDFDFWENYPYRILFAGCSITEGIGLPLEDTWAYLLHKKICSEFNINVPYWNVGSGGTGIDQLVRYVYNLKDFLRPQIIISYLPSKERRELTFEQRWGPWSLETVEGRNTEIFLNKELAMYQTEKNIAMIEFILNEIDSNFFFSSMDEEIDIKNYSSSPRFVQRSHKPEQYDIARDGIHGGPGTNKIMAERAFEFFKPFIIERLGLTLSK